MSVCDYLRCIIEQSLFFKLVDEEDIIIIVKACTKKKSSNFEDVSMDIVAKVICHPQDCHAHM